MTQNVARTHARRVVILILVLAAIVTVTALDATHDAIRHLLELARGVILRYPRLGLLLFVLVAALSGMLVFFSSAIIIPVAVFAWGRPMTIALLFAGWMLGGIGSYLIGRYPGRRIFKRLIPDREIRRYEKAISNKTPFTVILLFQIALQSEIPGYVLGAAKYDFKRYLAALAISELPYAVGAIYLSEGFIGRNYPLVIGLGAATILITVIALRMFHRRLQ